MIMNDELWLRYQNFHKNAAHTPCKLYHACTVWKVPFVSFICIQLLQARNSATSLTSLRDPMYIHILIYLPDRVVPIE